MARYIDAEKLTEKLSRMIDYCKKDNKVNGLTALFQLGDAIMDCPTADVAEVKHGRWHIISEDPDYETDSPTEEGWYRIITYDGEEMTDYFFGKPTLVGYGIGYWRNCKKVIRAWAKMDGKDTNVST